MKTRSGLGGIAIGCVALTLYVACSGASSDSVQGFTASTADGSSAGTGTSSGGASSTGSGNTGVGGSLGIDGGSKDGSSMMDGDACGSVPLVGKVTPGNIVVVFDQSDSMNQPFTTPDAGAAGEKYKVAEDALVAAVTPIENLLHLGTIFFPTTATGNTCSLVATIDKAPQIKIEPAPMFITDFQGHFAAPGWTLILGTPLELALTNANTALPDPSPLVGARAVLLITDGAPTCVTMAAAILAPVKAMFMRGIKTYAIGLPGSAAASALLNQIAMAGGTNQYLSPADPAALEAALAQIASDTIDQCTITLDPPPPDKDEVYLFVTDANDPKGVQVPQSDADGWTISADGKTATLTGAVCDKAKKGGYTKIEFVYGCPVAPN